VAAGGELFEAGTSARAGGVTLLKNRVTGVVDLGGVPPLPLDQLAQNSTASWNEYADSAVEVVR